MDIMFAMPQTPEKIQPKFHIKTEQPATEKKRKSQTNANSPLLATGSPRELPLLIGGGGSSPTFHD